MDYYCGPKQQLNGREGFSAVSQIVGLAVHRDLADRRTEGNGTNTDQAVVFPRSQEPRGNTPTSVLGASRRDKPKSMPWCQKRREKRCPSAGSRMIVGRRYASSIGKWEGLIKISTGATVARTASLDWRLATPPVGPSDGNVIIGWWALSSADPNKIGGLTVRGLL